MILSGRKGVLQSEGFPNSYPSHLRSSWKISVPRGFRVKFHITDLAITGETGQCKEDKLVISDDYSTLGELIYSLLVFFIFVNLLFLSFNIL